jgi:long-chain acyl-CoA synthetase
VLSTGEKVAPADLEGAILGDGLLSQVLVIGEGRPFLAALAVPDPEAYAAWTAREGLPAAFGPAQGYPNLEQTLLARINRRLQGFPGYAGILRVALLDRPWSIESGLMTPTLKLKRARILAEYRETLDALYIGHT